MYVPDSGVVLNIFLFDYRRLKLIGDASVAHALRKMTTKDPTCTTKVVSLCPCFLKLIHIFVSDEKVE